MMNATLLTSSPLIAWPYLAPLLVLAALVVVYALLRRARGSVWRLAGTLVLAGILINPSLVHERRAPIKDVAILAVDRSQSQELGDRAKRTDDALAYLKETLAKFPDLDTRVITFGGDSNTTGETDLFAKLNEAVSDIPRGRLAGTIVLTDGEIADVPADATNLVSLGPIHTLLSGTHDERDRRLSIVSAPAYGIVGKSVTVTVRVDDTPGINEKTAKLTWSQDGGEDNTVDVPVGVDTPIELTLTHEGKTVISLDAASVPNELTLANNRAALLINGVRDRLKVLLVSGEPYPGERAWRNLLKSDPSVDLVHFTILRPPEKQDATPIKELALIAFPIKELFEEKLKQFDLIIFDRYEQRGILPQAYYQNIADYVRGGGALLDASGPTLSQAVALYNTPVGDVIPVEPGAPINAKFKPVVTPQGERHPVTASLPGDGAWGSWFRQTGATPKDGAEVVMTGANGQPLLVLAHEGKGRVAELTSDQIWLWAKGYEGGGPQTELMRRIAHWLMKEPALDENTLTASIDNGTLSVTRTSLAATSAPVTVTAPSGATATLSLDDNGSQATGTMKAPESGIYKVTAPVGAPTGDNGTLTALAVSSLADAPEFRDVLTTEEKMKPVAAATDGAIGWLADDRTPEVRRVPDGRAQHGGGASSLWLGLRQNGGYTVTGIDKVPLLPALPVLVLALTVLFLAWRREGK